MIDVRSGGSESKSDGSLIDVCLLALAKSLMTRSSPGGPQRGDSRSDWPTAGFSALGLASVLGELEGFRNHCHSFLVVCTYLFVGGF